MKGGNESLFCASPLSWLNWPIRQASTNLQPNIRDSLAFSVSQLLAGLFTPRDEENPGLQKCPQFVLQYLLHMWNVAVPKMCCMVSCYPMAKVPETCFSFFPKMAISKVSLDLSLNLSKAKTGVKALSWLSWNSNLPDRRKSLSKCGWVAPMVPAFIGQAVLFWEWWVMDQLNWQW